MPLIELIDEGLTYLGNQSWESLFALFWFVIIFEIPRYALLFITSIVMMPFQKKYHYAPGIRPRITVCIAGHNEEEVLERCVLSMREQTWQPDEIIVVSDGSTDKTEAKIRSLMSRGLISQAHTTDLRSGKSAASNLAVRHATGDLVVNIDCDCSLERDAIEQACKPFADPAVGAVCGNVVVLNPCDSLVATMQAIEYNIAITLGRQAANITNHVVCISGAFGVFRREAIMEVNGYDAGGGEDLDITLRLRRAGWKIRFAADAMCFTRAPARLQALVRQRFRWERDAVRLRYRKYGAQLNPLSRQMQWLELLHQIEFLIFNVGAAIILPFYLIWLFSLYGAEMAVPILLGAQAGMLVIDSVIFCMASLWMPRMVVPHLIIYMPVYSLFTTFFMRFVRLFAYIQEWVFKESYADSFVPSKVHRQRF